MVPKERGPEQGFAGAMLKDVNVCPNAITKKAQAKSLNYNPHEAQIFNYRKNTIV